MLSRIQRGLERLYRVETDLEVDDFLVGSEARDRAGVVRRPREQLLLTEDEEGLSIGLYLDDEVLESVANQEPGEKLARETLGDFLLAVEGVSHFLYLTWRAQMGQPVSALELELQAEVDKYVTCLLHRDRPEGSSGLRERLFVDVEYEEDLDREERDRYQVANDSALRYSGYLEAEFVRPRRIPGMLRELRRFYRLSLRGKMERILQAA